MRRTVYIITGILCVILGIVGIFLPVLPTTPFLVGAAWLFARSSPKASQWLLNHRILGIYVRDYHEGRGVPLRIKVFAIIMLWLGISSSALFFVDFPPAKILLVVIAVVVTIHILRLPTRRIDTAAISRGPLPSGEERR